MKIVKMFFIGLWRRENEENELNDLYLFSQK